MGVCIHLGHQQVDLLPNELLLLVTEKCGKQGVQVQYQSRVTLLRPHSQVRDLLAVDIVVLVARALPPLLLLDFLSQLNQFAACFLVIQHIYDKVRKHLDRLVVHVVLHHLAVVLLGGVRRLRDPRTNIHQAPQVRLVFLEFNPKFFVQIGGHGDELFALRKVVLEGDFVHDIRVLLLVSVSDLVVDDLHVSVSDELLIQSRLAQLHQLKLLQRARVAFLPLVEEERVKHSQLRRARELLQPFLEHLIDFSNESDDHVPDIEIRPLSAF